MHIWQPLPASQTPSSAEQCCFLDPPSNWLDRRFFQGALKDQCIEFRPLPTFDLSNSKLFTGTHFPKSFSQVEETQVCAVATRQGTHPSPHWISTWLYQNNQNPLKTFFPWQCLYITTVSVHQRSIKARKCGHVISSASTNLAKNLLWNGRIFSWGKNWVRMPSLAHSAHASACATHLTLSQSTPASPDPCCSITLCQDRVQQHLKHH